MLIQLPWGPGTLPLELPDTWDVVIPKRREGAKKGASKKAPDELALVRESLRKPIGAKPLGSLRLRGKNVVVIVDDNTRPTPVHRFFHLILDALKKAGANPRKVMVIPGLGIHTPMTEAEMAVKLGPKNLKAVTWENHDAFDLNANHYFGTTGRNTPVYLNRRLKDADMIILVGVMEPHLWAGFGGGLKNILPGVAYSETIGIHHGILAEPPYRVNRVGMMPEENSFRRDLEEVRRMIPAEIFCVNVAIDQDRRIIASFAGDPVESHREGVAFIAREQGLHLERRVEGIILNSHPFDINFKQGMRCVGNSLPALEPGGAVMSFMRAERGLDDITPPEGSKPLWLAKRVLRIAGASRVMKVLEKTKKGLNPEEKFLVYYSMQLMREYDFFIHAPTITPAMAKSLGFFVHCGRPEDVIRHGIKKLGKHARVAVFTEPGVTYPIVE
ncbi:MAG: nickel-dependent lactate racemase [Spirochaetes bacterium]|nr:nickel-dependent lactate racemase [Spirochaetota bacterium]